MKKKIVCLVLAMLMVLPLLAGCSQTGTIESINEEASRYTTTLNMWLITESQAVVDAAAVILSGVTPKKETANTLTDAEKAVVAAMSKEEREAWLQVWEVSEGVNRLTKANYKVQLNLKYFLESDYYAAVEAAFLKHEENIAAGNVTVENKTEETVLNEYGIPELKYPTVPDYEVDILFIGNQQKYFDYIDKGWLVELQDHLGDAAVKLNSYVSGSYLNAASVDGSLYAFPNNHGVGEYVYLLADKQLLDEYNSDLTGATLYDSDFKEYLDYVYTTYTGQDKIYPIYTDNASGKIDLDYAHYWSFDLDSAPGLALQSPDKFFLYGDSSTNKTQLSNTNLLTDEAYMKALANKVHYEGTADYITTDAEAKAAVRVVTGGWELKAAYEEQGYEVLVMQYPELTDSEVYSSMFGIGKYSVSDTRAAEIITFLNTDAEVRNILQYGIEDVNYILRTVEGTDYVYVEPTYDNIYRMDINKTGNVFLAYSDSAASVLRWEYEKKQNLEMVKYPTLGLKFSDSYKLDEKSIRVMNAVSEKLAEVIGNMQTAAEVEALYFSALQTNNRVWSMVDLILSYTGTDLGYTVNGETVAIDRQMVGDAINSLQNTTIDESAQAQAPYALYYDWCVRMGIVSSNSQV